VIKTAVCKECWSVLLFASPSHTSVGPFAMSLSRETFLFAMIVGRKVSLFASPHHLVRKPLQLSIPSSVSSRASLSICAKKARCRINRSCVVAIGADRKFKALCAPAPRERSPAGGPQRAAVAPPERSPARRSAVQRHFRWCWTGVSGWGRGALQGGPWGDGGRLEGADFKKNTRQS